MLIYDNEHQMPKTYDTKKVEFSLIVEQKLAFPSSTNLVREVQNLSLNFKRIA